MNTKTSFVKSVGLVGTVSTLTAAYVLSPPFSPTPIIMAPFVTESVSLKNNTAEVVTQDEKFTLDIEFEADYYWDGNGYESWGDVELTHLKDIRVYNEDGEVAKYYMSQIDVRDLVATIEQSLRDHL